MKTKSIIAALAAAVMLAAGASPANAQLRGLLNRAKEAVEKTTDSTSTPAGNNPAAAVTGAAAGTAAEAALSPEQKAAVEKLRDPSKYTNPPLEHLSDDGGSIDKWFLVNTGQMLGDTRTRKDAETFKAAILPRARENWEMIRALYDFEGPTEFWQIPDVEVNLVMKEKTELAEVLRSGDSDHSLRSALEVLKEEFASYRYIMSSAARLLGISTGITIEGDQNASPLNVQYRERAYSPLQSPEFIVSDAPGIDGPVLADVVGEQIRPKPLPQDVFIRKCTEYDIAATLMINDEQGGKQSKKALIATLMLRQLMTAQNNAKLHEWKP